MRLVAAALAGALVAGVGVYLWRDAELDSRQARLIRTALDQTAAEITVERLEQQVEELRHQLDRLRRDLIQPDAGGDRSLEAPPLSVEADGRYFGYIEWIDLDTDPNVLVIDFAEFLTGEEAEKAAEAAGAEVLDYYVSNVNPRLRTLEISSDVAVTLETWDRHNIPDPKEVSIELLARIFEQPKNWERRIGDSGYWLTIEQGEIKELREQYVP